MIVILFYNLEHCIHLHQSEGDSSASPDVTLGQLRVSIASRRFRSSPLKIVNTLKTYRLCSKMACGHRGLCLFNCYHGLRVTTGSHPSATAAGPKENTKGSAAASSSTSTGSRSRLGSTTTQGNNRCNQPRGGRGGGRQ